ncbi:MAG: M18 family aminopeptidase, partial [Oscillospiraceae bacterium]|nr:M18 family aminopeptidase [Oscillospiraceae bacterium]
MDILSGLRDFIVESPGSFHAVAALQRRLDAAGFTRLRENERWTLTPGQGYYVTRNASIVSFRLPAREVNAIHIIASHSDSPSFKLKPDPALWREGTLRLNVEGYGGMIRRSWLDRPLSVAGRVLIADGDALREKLVYVDRDLLLIPSLAIHLSRDASAPVETLSVQNELLPLLGLREDGWARVLGEAAGTAPERILGADLFLTCRAQPSVWGADREFFSAPRLDDLACVYTTLCGFLAAAPAEHIAVHAVFDNEEVGSRSLQGAESDFLAATLRRACRALALDDEGFAALLADSFLVSADNAHALHPNYAGRYDPVNRPQLNGGIVLKHQAGQRYTTDAVSEALLRSVCRRCGVPVQDYANHADVPGGSTLGNISVTQLSVRSVDVGLPQLAMHAAYETMGAQDAQAMAD